MYVKMRRTNNAAVMMNSAYRHHGYYCILSPLNKHSEYRATRGGMIGSARIIDRSLAEGAKSHISYHIRSHQVLCLSIAMFSYAFLYIGIFIYIGN